MIPTVASITTCLGVPYCRGITRQGFYCHEDHGPGGTTKDGTLHLRDAPVTRTGLKTLLKLIAQVQDPTLNEDVPWRRVYRISVAVRALAARLQVRLPRKAFEADRAFVRASVAGLPNSVPMRKQAYDWARR